MRFCSVLDDNKLLTLPNGERLNLPPNVRIMFEVEHLKYATLATVSRCGMIWFSGDVVEPSMVYVITLPRCRLLLLTPMTMRLAICLHDVVMFQYLTMLPPRIWLHRSKLPLSWSAILPKEISSVQHSNLPNLSSISWTIPSPALSTHSLSSQQKLSGTSSSTTSSTLTFPCRWNV